MNISETLISFETAKLAKEKGLNFISYLTRKDSHIVAHNYIKDTEINDCNWYYNITQSLLQKWLRERHNLRVNSDYYTFGVESTNGYYYRINQGTLHGKSNTYEEALEQGLQEALKLI